MHVGRGNQCPMEEDLSRLLPDKSDRAMTHRDSRIMTDASDDDELWCYGLRNRGLMHSTTNACQTN